MFCRTERTHIWRALCWIPFHSFLQSPETKFGILKKKRTRTRRVCVFLSTDYFCGQSQQKLTVKKIRVRDAKHGQTSADKSRFVVILLLIGSLSMRFHFTNHNLLVWLRLVTAITTFVCFDRELEEKASFKPQLKSAVRESPLDFCRFWKFFKVSTGDFCFRRQTKTNTVQNYFSR